jgi:putative Ca2+/H+ antiporter (TMEM165/GDT1 family)
VNLVITAAVFPVIFLGELPDKSMFASLVLASRGRPLAVWVGTAAGFLIHVVIAVLAGGLLSLVPHRIVNIVVALLFALGAYFAFRSDDDGDAAAVTRPAGPVTARTAALTALSVTFVAEWGDLTQILTASLAARYHDPVSVGVGAVAGLWAVAGLAVVAGRQMSRVPAHLVRRLTGVILVVLAVLAAISAATGTTVL